MPDNIYCKTRNGAKTLQDSIVKTYNTIKTLQDSIAETYNTIKTLQDGIVKTYNMAILLVFRALRTLAIPQ